jgi:hypothetical protein
MKGLGRWRSDAVVSAVLKVDPFGVGSGVVRLDRARFWHELIRVGDIVVD